MIKLMSHIIVTASNTWYKTSLVNNQSNHAIGLISEADNEADIIVTAVGNMIVTAVIVTAFIDVNLQLS